MKKILIAAVMLMAVMTAGCTAKQAEVKEPEVNLNITVEALSEEEYADTSTDGIEIPVIEDFAKVTVELNMNNMVPGTERTVKMTALKNIMAETGVGTHWYSSGSSSNNAEDDFSTFKAVNVIFRRDVTDEELKNMFEGYNAVVTYTGADGVTVEETLAFIVAVQFK